MIDERLLAAPIAVIHGPQLRDRLVRLIHEHEKVAGEVIHQGGRRLARTAPRQMPGVVLHARAAAHLLEHLKIKHGALLEPLRLEQPLPISKLRQTSPELVADAPDRGGELLLGRDVMARGKDRHAVHLPPDDAAQRVDLRDRVHLVAEELDAHGAVVLVRWEDLHHVPARPECAAMEVHIIALILHLHETSQQLVAVDLLAHRDGRHHPVVGLGGADAEDARHARHDDHVTPAEQRVGRRVPHAVDLLVDVGVLLDERVGRGDVGLWLVVVVVADEVLHPVVGKQRLELPVQLRRQGLVVHQDERGSLHVGDDVRHGEGLAAPGDPEQHLVGLAISYAGGERLDRLWLAATGFKVRDQLKGAVRGDLRAHGVLKVPHGRGVVRVVRLGHAVNVAAPWPSRSSPVVARGS